MIIYNAQIILNSNGRNRLSIIVDTLPKCETHKTIYFDDSEMYAHIDKQTGIVNYHFYLNSDVPETSRKRQFFSKDRPKCKFKYLQFIGVSVIVLSECKIFHRGTLAEWYSVKRVEDIGITIASARKIMTHFKLDETFTIVQKRISKESYFDIIQKRDITGTALHKRYEDQTTDSTDNNMEKIFLVTKKHIRYGRENFTISDGTNIYQRDYRTLPDYCYDGLYYSEYKANIVKPIIFNSELAQEKAIEL